MADEKPIAKSAPQGASLLEELQEIIRFESIFMPFAKERRDDHLTNNGRFVHYTSAESALSIIKTRRLWMRNATVMSDFSEIQHGFGMLHGFISNKDEREKFEQALETCFPGILSEVVGIFDAWWQSYQLGTYIASVSDHDGKEEDRYGRLSMWRAFGASTSRVALVFNVSAFAEAQALLRLFNPVMYLEQDELNTQFKRIGENIRENTSYLQSIGRERIVYTLFATFITAVVCLKNKCFKEEREWRVIYNPARGAAPFVETSTEVISGIPQIVHKLPLDGSGAGNAAGLDFVSIFDRAIVGPTPYPWIVSQALDAALKESGVKDAGERIHISGIPIRA